MGLNAPRQDPRRRRQRNSRRADWPPYQPGYLVTGNGARQLFPYVFFFFPPGPVTGGSPLPQGRLDASRPAEGCGNLGRRDGRCSPFSYAVGRRVVSLKRLDPANRQGHWWNHGGSPGGHRQRAGAKHEPRERLES